MLVVYGEGDDLEAYDAEAGEGGWFLVVADNETEVVVEEVLLAGSAPNLG